MLKDDQAALLHALLRGERPPGIDEDGFVLTSLLIQKLRFERICRGSKRVEQWFDRDPESFTQSFRAYNAEVPPTEYFPRQEADAFVAWCVKKGTLPPPSASTKA